MRILHGLAIASAMLISLPAFTPPAEAGDKHRHRHGHGHHYHGGGKQVFYDGPYRVERRWHGHGYAPGYYAYPPGYYVAPAPVYYYPPPPRYVPHGPSISVTIPLD
jgi:hypothetical protein